MRLLVSLAVLLLVPPATFAAGSGAWVYLADSGVACYTVPRTELVPVAGASIGASVTGWQGMAALPSLPETVTVTGTHPLTEAPIAATVPVQRGTGAGAIAGYAVRGPDGRLTIGDVPATEANAIYALRVQVGDRSAVPMNDGHFLFEGIPQGPQAVIVTAIYAGEVHRAESTVEAIAGETVVPGFGETSVSPAPPLSFWRAWTFSRWGSPTAFYAGGAVVNEDGVPPIDSGLRMSITTEHDGLHTFEGESSVGIETGRFTDAVLTAALGDFATETTVASGGSIPYSDRIVAPVNVDVQPNPVVIGKPAVIRWQHDEIAPGPDPSAYWMRIADGVFGQRTTLEMRPKPDWFGYHTFYPRQTWVLGPEETSVLQEGATYVLRIESVDGLDQSAIHQRCRTNFTFTATLPGNAPPVPPGIVQRPLPTDAGQFDGVVYFAETPDGEPLGDDLVISPRPVAHLVPAVHASVAVDGGPYMRTGRTGHLHLDGVEPGTHTISFAVENPTTGTFFSTDIAVEFVPAESFEAEYQQGAIIAYFHEEGAGVKVSADPWAGTPHYGSRLIVDGVPDNPAVLCNVLADSEGRVEAEVDPGMHQLRFEAVRNGQVWVAEQAVDVRPGMISTVSTLAIPVAPASPINLLGAHGCDTRGLDSGNPFLVRAVDTDGNYPSYERASRPPQLLTYGPGDWANLPYRKVVDGWAWMGQTWNYGEWQVPGLYGEGRIRAWTSPDGFGDLEQMLWETPTYIWEMTPPISRSGEPVAMVPWIRTIPRQLVAGKPGVVYWGESPTHHYYQFSGRRAGGTLDKVPLGDPYRGLTAVSRSRVRVLSREETGTWLKPTAEAAGLCVRAFDNQYYNLQRRNWFNQVTIQQALPAEPEPEPEPEPPQTVAAAAPVLSVQDWSRDGAMVDVRRGELVTRWVRMTNEADTATALRVRGAAGDGPWQVWYSDADGADITEAVTSDAGWLSRVVWPGQSTGLRVHAYLEANAPESVPATIVAVAASTEPWDAAGTATVRLVLIAGSEMYGAQKPLRGAQLNSAHPLALGLVGAWLMNEGTGSVVADYSGNGNHGTLSALDPTSAWVGGPFGHTVEFDGGVGASISIGNGPSIIGGGPFTVSAMVRNDHTAKSENKIIYSQRDGTTTASMSLRVQATTGYLFGWCYQGADQWGSSLVGNVDLSDGEWHHVAFTRSEDLYGRLYLDGVLHAEQAPTASARNLASVHCDIGIDYRDTRWEWQGGIDHVYVWNRALSLDEVASIAGYPYQVVTAGGE